jgi:hypothetical protein
MNRISETPGVVYSNKDQSKTNRELISKYDKRIVDMLHKIEFIDATPAQAYKMYMKLQGFLRKKRDLKKSGSIYTPRTETGNYIINGKVTNKKKENTNNGNR